MARSPMPQRKGFENGRDSSPVSRRSKDPMRLVDNRELLGMARNAFRGSQKQKTAWVQGVVKRLHHPVLQLGIEVDQDIAAGDQIEPREGRIFDNAMRGERA